MGSDATATPAPFGAPVRVGDVIDGKYRVDRLLGGGGMGVVFAGRHLAVDEPVALKVLRSGYEADREIVERTMREARATFRLRSSHTVRVMDVGQLPSGAVYLVMELLDGHDLRSELKAKGPLPEGDVAKYACEACDALDEAHELGVIHRDLKPENLFLSRSAAGRPVVKVLDFGTSKLDPRLFGTPSLTAPETVLGSPRYMSPEQWRAMTVDKRTDIWSLGIVMYELLVGGAPLADLELSERRARMLAGAFPSPEQVRREISEAVSRIVVRCLRADPEARWPSAAHLAAALRGAHPGAVPTVRSLEPSRTETTEVVPARQPPEQVAAGLPPESSGEAERRTQPEGPRVRLGAAAAQPEAPVSNATLVSPGAPVLEQPSTGPPPLPRARPTAAVRTPPWGVSEPARRTLLVAGAVLVALVALACTAMVLRWILHA